MTTLTIAEIGVNHNGELGHAEELVIQAANSGADFVKFQTFKSERVVTESSKKAFYQTKDGPDNESQFDLLKRLELSPNDFRHLSQFAKQAGIDFLSTGFDIQDVSFICELNVPYLKVPSGEITNKPLLDYIGNLGKPVILSTGMSAIDEVESAVNCLCQAGLDRTDLTILHCNSAYPTPYQDVNLKAMLTMGETFGTKFGYSDHTPGVEVPIAAVALGATIIEKHFTLDRNLPGPDQNTSLEPTEFSNMVHSIRNIEAALGNGEKFVSESELENRDVVRRSIVAARSIDMGERLTSSNLTVKRPGKGLSPMAWDSIVGQVSKHCYQKDDFIKP